MDRQNSASHGRKGTRTRIALFLAVTLAVLTPTGTIADEPHRRDEGPDIVLGVAAGFVDHFGKTVEVDAASGATTQLEDRNINHPGGAAGVYADGGLLRLGPGDLGLTLGFYTSFPDLYFDFAIVPRYRLLFDTSSAKIPRVEPWIGFPMFFTFHEKLSADYYFMFGGSLGCDLALGESNWVVGLALHINAVDPIPVRETIEIHGQRHKVEHRLDSVFAVLSFGYRVL